MKKLFKIALILFFCLVPLSFAMAEDALTREERTWVKKHGTIRVAMSHDYAPFVFKDKFGEPRGMGIDFWRLISGKLQLWLQFYSDSFQNQLDGVMNSKYDSIVGIFPLEERRKFFDFTRPYTVIRTFAFVKPKFSTLKNLLDLKNLKVYAVSGDSGEAIARKMGLDPLPCATYREAVFKLADGDAEAIILDEPVVNYFVKEFDLQNKIQKVGEPADEGRMTLPVRKGNKILLEILNKGVGRVTDTEWGEIENRWFGERKGVPSE